MPGTGSLCRSPLEPRQSKLASIETPSLTPLRKHPEQPGQRIEITVNHPLLQRNNSIVRNRNRLRANLRTALRDITVADPELFFELRHAVGSIAWVHLERCQM